MNYDTYSVADLTRLLGTRFKSYRLRTRMTQKDVATVTGLSVTTIHNFENGLSANLTLGTFLLMLKAIGCIDNLDELLPELPESPYSRPQRTVQRIRNKK